jgi:tol-pal system protein YbgF
MVNRTLLCFLVMLLLPMAAQAQRGNLTLAERVSALEEQQGGGGSDLMLELLDRVDSMQREMQELRGTIEQQAHEIEQLQRRQRDQYLDLDRRLQQAGSMADAGAASGGMAQPTGDTAGPSTDDAPSVSNLPSGGSTSALPEVRSEPPPEASIQGLGEPQVDVSGSLVNPQAEREAYDASFQKLRNGRYADAASDFRQFIEQYPNGQFIDNAYYWLGESYYVTRNYDLAQEAFEAVLNEHPDGSKYPDAMLKLGFTHYELANFDRARRFLEQVVAEFPDTTVARLAEGRLRAMRLEGR